MDSHVKFKNLNQSSGQNRSLGRRPSTKGSYKRNTRVYTILNHPVLLRLLSAWLEQAISQLVEDEGEDEAGAASDARAALTPRSQYVLLVPILRNGLDLPKGQRLTKLIKKLRLTKAKPFRLVLRHYRKACLEYQNSAPYRRTKTIRSR